MASIIIIILWSCLYDADSSSDLTYFSCLINSVKIYCLIIKVRRVDGRRSGNDGEYRDTALYLLQASDMRLSAATAAAVLRIMAK